MPTFPPRGLSPEEAPQVSRNIDPFQRTLDLACSPEEKRNFEHIADAPKVVKATQRRVIRVLAMLAAKLKRLQLKLHGEINQLAPARGLRIPLIAILFHKIGYTDKTLPSDLTKGMKITGAIEPSHVLTYRKTYATKHFVSPKAGFMDRNALILRSLMNAKRPGLWP